MDAMCGMYVSLFFQKPVGVVRLMLVMTLDMGNVRRYNMRSVVV